MKDAILRKINAQEFSMRPRIFFTAKLVALVVVATAVLLISVFIVNFILFSIRINSHATLLGFGLRGIEAFLLFFPWALFVLDIALIASLQWMLHWFRFGYKTPALYLLSGLVLLTLGAGFVIDEGTPVNDQFLREADEHRLPSPFGDFYGRARHLPSLDDGFCLCTIEVISGNTLVVNDTHSTTTVTVMLPTDDLRATTSGLMVGDRVLIAGDRDGDTIEAFGVRKVNN